jgi:hypothetical protein
MITLTLTQNEIEHILSAATTANISLRDTQEVESIKFIAGRNGNGITATVVISDTTDVAHIEAEPSVEEDQPKVKTTRKPRTVFNKVSEPEEDEQSLIDEELDETIDEQEVVNATPDEDDEIAQETKPVACSIPTAPVKKVFNFGARKQ